MVYITPGLFGHDYTHPIFSSSTHAHIQNHMVDSQVAAGLGKRKRRPEDDKDMPSPKHISITSRTSPTSEGHIRLYGHNPASHEASLQRMSARSPRFPSSERRPVKHMKRLLVKTPSHLMDTEPDFVPRSPPVQKVDSHTKSDLSPCHVCSTAPKRKRDLEGYMDCERCTERTCYICARECLGCRKAICKECIVELGQDGEPWCLHCYQHMNT
ncbi:hypothetical protein P171DRAFT_373537 [Karstenula rhodostoma CBS 690.94]|uniref:Uncharacterized protein n=1 Tax=Karstenula rhodostoma CBS 690.94 TaxID=1392251 RepID=A0A9P4U4S2_9PLEO|nr:hypothetical protein P171DRAFT_373537 [Karstenula rhodostoma CBS 690.94]